MRGSQDLQRRHRALSELNKVNDARSRRAAYRRWRDEDEMRRKAEETAREAVRLAEEARIERIERLEGIGKRLKEANERKFQEHAQRKEGIVGLWSLTASYGMALKDAAAKKNITAQQRLQREIAQQRLERNIERQRKWDERVRAELEAQNIDPLREAEVKNQRITERVERAKARRDWNLRRPLFDPDTGRPPRLKLPNPMRRTWSNPGPPETPSYPMGPLPDDGEVDIDEGAVASEGIVQYFLEDHGPYEERPKRSLLATRREWKNTSN
jgi:hypothetical protein